MMRMTEMIKSDFMTALFDYCTSRAMLKETFAICVRFHRNGRNHNFYSITKQAGMGFLRRCSGIVQEKLCHCIIF